jgi:hypothetical protein
MSQFADMAVRFWDELVSRSSGPLAFRFYLQPVMASLLAIRDGRKDAIEGRRPYLWAILSDPSCRREHFHEAFRAVARVILLGVVMDAIYQIFVLKAFRPLELIFVVLLLAFLPYLLVRGPAGRIVRWWRQRPPTAGTTHLSHDH